MNNWKTFSTKEVIPFRLRNRPGLGMEVKWVRSEEGHEIDGSLLPQKMEFQIQWVPAGNSDGQTDHNQKSHQQRNEHPLQLPLLKFG